MAAFQGWLKSWKMEDQFINVLTFSSKLAVPDSQMECYQQQVRQFVNSRPLWHPLWLKSEWLSAFSKSYTSLLRRWPSPPLNRQLSLSMDPSRWTTPNLRFLKSSNIVYILFCQMNIFSESYGGCLGPALPPLLDISQVFKINVIRFPYLISRLPLRTDAFRLGRAKSCDYVIR